MSDELKIGVASMIFIFAIGFGLTQITIAADDHEYRMAQLKCKESK
jgi:hypothetical protein